MKLNISKIPTRKELNAELFRQYLSTVNNGGWLRRMMANGQFLRLLNKKPL